MTLEHYPNTDKIDQIKDSHPQFGGGHMTLTDNNSVLRGFIGARPITENTIFSMFRTIGNRKLDEFFRQFKHPSKEGKTLYFSSGLARLFHERIDQVMRSKDRKDYFGLDVVSGQSGNVSFYLPRTHLIRAEGPEQVKELQSKIVTLIDNLASDENLLAIRGIDAPQNYNKNTIGKLLETPEKPNPLIRLEDSMEISGTSMKAFADMLLRYDYRYEQRGHYD